ncbi:Response regulator of zinc sigma-54-dependent two-component system [hydrothermal vent metagenome]|uniref:DNA-binding transcriptional regulator NtrC n=1 Tax=hydrothermal vent metagenome TaxID=652676 RepID=A0A3B0VHW0_9ZZZZ
MTKLLIVDDEKSVRYAFKRTFGDVYDIITAEDGIQGLEAVESAGPDIVLMDIRMPRLDGLTALKRLHEQKPTLPVIMMTAYADSATAMRAMQEGAFDYIVKPFDNDDLRLVIDKAEAAVRVRGTLRCECVPEARDLPLADEFIIGTSSVMLEVCKQIGLVAAADLPVLISGETGVGKELAARAIYQYSGHHQQGLMVVNCAALPDNLVESELFGYEPGAFTGAGKQRIGRFEQCDGGTIFLDEIGELSLPAQAKILRVVQEGTFERLGGDRPLITDVRIIAATNRNLAEMVRHGTFRGDLLHRINVFDLQIPPLRERLADLPSLVTYFIRRFGSNVSPPVTGIGAEALDLLSNYNWPGNIRQLENVIRRAAILTKSGVIDRADCLIEDHNPAASDFSLALNRRIDKLMAQGESRPYHQLLAEMETLMIDKALALTQGNQVRAAELLGINRMTLRKKIVLKK